MFMIGLFCFFIFPAFDFFSFMLLPSAFGLLVTSFAFVLELFLAGFLFVVVLLRLVDRSTRHCRLLLAICLLLAYPLRFSMFASPPSRLLLCTKVNSVVARCNQVIPPFSVEVRQVSHLI